MPIRKRKVIEPESVHEDRNIGKVKGIKDRKQTYPTHFLIRMSMIFICILILLSVSIGVVSATTSSGWESEADLVRIGDDNKWPNYFAYPHIAYNLRGDGKWVLISHRNVNNYGSPHGYYYDDNANKWVEDSSLVSGVECHCWCEYSAFAYNVTGDDKWTLISHCSAGFYGYYWDGTQWIEDSSRVSGLPEVAGSTSHTLIEDLTGDGKWTLLTGIGDGTFRAFYWNGIGWIEDSTRVNGLPVTDGYSRATAGFNVFGENNWNLIITTRHSKSFRVFCWDGTQWIEDITKAAGLNTSLTQLKYLVPTLGYNLRGDGKWVLISGVGKDYTLLGFQYNSVDTSTLPSQTNITSHHPLATTVRINLSYPYTWNHRVKYSTNPDMSNALWSETFEDMDEVDVKLTRLNPGTTYYYEVYTYIPWDTVYYVKSSVKSFTTLSAQDPVTVNPGDSIQDAIEMLPLSGGTVNLAAGVHEVYDTIVIYMSNITIQGTQSSEIRSCDSSKDVFAIPHEGPFSVDEPWDTMPLLENFTFKGFKVTSTYTTQGGVFIHAWKVKNFTVEDIYDSSHTVRLVALSPAGTSTKARNENIYIRNNTMEHNGVSVADSDNVYILNNTILGSSCNWAIYADHGLKHIKIIGNRVINAGSNAALIVDLGDDWEIRDNYFQGSPGGVDFSQPVLNAIFENNTIIGAGTFGIMIKPQALMKNVTIRNNRIYNNGIGIWASQYQGASGVSEINITNNVIYGNSDDGIKMTSEHVGLDITNNIITNNGGYGINYEKGEISHSYNDVWGNTLGSYSGTSAGTGEIQRDPLFADPANGDFHIKSTAGRKTDSGWITDSEDSPCIDKGDHSSDYSNELDYPSGYINMGASGNTAEASLGTSAGPDTIPPTITIHYPTGASVSGATTVSVTFSEAMNETSAENAFSISPSASGSFNWNGNQIGFTPDAIFDYATTYTVTIGTGAQDLAGNNLAGEYSWQFTTITTGVWASGWESEADLVRIGDDDKWSISYYAYPHIAYNLRGDGKWVLISNREVNDAYFGYYYDDSENKWVEDSSLVSGLTSHCWREYPAFAYNVMGDSKWTLISHCSDAFYGYYWGGTKWIEDSSRVNGLTRTSGKTSHTFIEDLTGDGKWTLLTGTGDGTFRAFYRDGTKWIEDSLRVNGLPETGDDSRVTAGYNVFEENKWNLITATRTSKSFRVFCWEGTQWIEDTTKAAGLTNVSDFRAPEMVPTLGYNLRGDGKWALISGVAQDYTLLGFYYNSVDTSSLPQQTDVTSYHPLATTVQISFSYPHTWNHQVKYSTDADMSAALWSDWFEDMDEVDVRLTRLNPGTTYYYEVYTYVPGDSSYYVKSSVNSFTTLSAQNPITVQPGESIPDAIETLPLEGGTIELAAGVHEVHDTIVIYMSNITIQGTHSSEIRSCNSDKGVFVIPHEGISAEEDWENMPVLENFAFKGFKVTSSYTSPGRGLIVAWNVKNLTVENILDESYLRSFASITVSGGSTTAHSEDIYIRNNIITRSAIGLGFADNMHVINNTIIDAFGMNGIDVNRGGNYVYIYNNHINGGSNYAIRGHSGNNVYIENNTLFSTQIGLFIDTLHHVTVSNNAITGCSYAGINIDPQPPLELNVTNNRMYNNPGHGVWTTEHQGHSGVTHVDLSNNVIYNNGGNGIEMTVDWVQMDISNNIITDNGGYGINYIETIEPTTISYNNVWQNALGNYNNTSPGTGDIEADPKFASTTSGEEDFHLKSTIARRTESGWVTDDEHSPCIDAGDPSSDYSNEPDHPNGHINIGVYGNTKETSRGTPAGPDTLPPYTSGHSPAKSATDIPRDTNIVVHIGDDGEGVNQSSIVMTVEGETVSLTITGDKNDYTSTYTPYVPFDYEQVVDITIEAQDLASNDMFLESYSFTLEQATGPTPPTITTSVPTGTDVSVATTLSVTFSEAMNETSAENAFSILPSVTGAFSWNGNKMTFTPSTNLDDETTYTVTLGTEAHDLAGNNLETEYNWQFSTVQSGEGLVGYWTLDEDNGDIVSDASGKGNDGTLGGNPIWTIGKINGALDFNGVDDYVRCGRDASLTPEYITVSAWIKPATDGTAYNIVRRDAHSNYNYEYGFGLGSDGKLSFSVGNGTARFSARSSALSWDSTGTTWYHVAATYDGSTTNIYRDGVLVGTDSNGIGAIATESFYYLFIGRSPVTTLSSFHGSIDEVKIYNRALSSDEILADYQISTGSISGTVTAYGGIIIEEVNITLATLTGDEIATTQTDSTGNYEFADVAPGFYNLNATKLGYWPDADPVTVTSDNQTTADISLSQKGDFNTNSEPADAGDLAMMVDATKAGTSDVTYDLDGDGSPADEDDLRLLKEVSVGVAELE